MIFLSQSVWNCTINNAAIDCWFLFPNSSMEGAAHGANQTQLTISAAASVRSIVKTFSHVTPGVASHVRMRNLEIHNQSFGTVANALVDIQGMYDSSFSDLTVDAMAGRGLWIHDFTSPAGGNSLAFFNTILDGQGHSGARPLVIEQNNASSNTSSIHFLGGDWGHPGSGQFLVEINGHGNTAFGHISIDNIYMESNNADTTTALIKLADVFQVNFNNVRMTRLSASSTAPGIAISETAINLTGNIGAKNLSVGGGTGCNNTQIITNSVPGAGTGNVGSSSCAIDDYSFLSSEIGDQSQIGNQWIFPNSSTLFGNISSARGASVTPNFPVFLYQPANTVTGLAFFQNTISEWRVGMPANLSDFCFGTNDTLTTCPVRFNSGAPNNSLNLNSSGQLVGLDVNSITNGPGLQIFNTSTTCTTGASVGATCTTANITLPVTEPDTNYRMWCMGRGFAAGVPVFLSATNVSTTQFTISIAALTAAAASFSSYDCVAGHN
jgi:hypothetical protein